MRDRRRTPAGGVQAEKQQRYVQLIAQGVNNSEACRLVGINRKTGNRWRYGRRVRNSAGALVIYPPVKINEAKPRSPRYLSEQERIRIADLLAARMTRARDRGAAGACAVNDQPRDPAQQRPGRPLPAPSRRARRSAAGVQAAQAADRCGWGAGRGRPAAAGEALEPGAGRARAAGAVRRAAVALAVQGDDLPGDLRHCGRDYAAGAAPATPPAAAGPAAPRTADRDADDRRAPSRGRGPCAGRSLGGRSDHGRREPVGDRHARGAHDPVS